MEGCAARGVLGNRPYRCAPRGWRRAGRAARRDAGAAGRSVRTVRRVHADRARPARHLSGRATRNGRTGAGSPPRPDGSRASRVGGAHSHRRVDARAAAAHRRRGAWTGGKRCADGAGPHHTAVHRCADRLSRAVWSRLDARDGFTFRRYGLATGARRRPSWRRPRVVVHCRLRIDRARPRLGVPAHRQAAQLKRPPDGLRDPGYFTVTVHATCCDSGG